MSLQDYAVARDKFEPAETTGNIPFPCFACKHLPFQLSEEPCLHCDHNANAEPDPEPELVTIYQRNAEERSY